MIIDDIGLHGFIKAYCRQLLNLIKKLSQDYFLNRRDAKPIRPNARNEIVDGDGMSTILIVVTNPATGGPS